MKHLFLICLTSLVIFSCKDDNVEPSDNNTKSETPIVTDTTVIVIDTTSNSVDTTTTETNTAPVTIDDNATTDRNTPVIINVLGNDTDPDGDDLRIINVSAPTSGSIVNNGNNITFTPDPTVTDIVTFTYTISDDKDSTTGSVTIDVIRTTAETNTDSLLSLFSNPVRVSIIDNRNVYADQITITISTDQSFIKHRTTDEFNIGNTENQNLTFYTINSLGQLVMDNVTYNVIEEDCFYFIDGTRIESDFLEVTFESITDQSINTTWTISKPK